MDPTGENGKMVKAGFDLTRPFGAPDIIENWISQTPRLKLNPRWQNVQQALESGPKHFIELMEGIGTDDGRALTLELDRLQRDGILGRGSNGEWLLKPRTA
jgi:hypothetical protein